MGTMHLSLEPTGLAGGSYGSLPWFPAVEVMCYFSRNQTPVKLTGWSWAPLFVFLLVDQNVLIRFPGTVKSSAVLFTVAMFSKLHPKLQK